MTRPLVVVGDVMLDVDRTGIVDRLSPEAPVPVLHDITDTSRPGGAALAALLAARSTSRPVVLIAPFADDDAARQVSEMLAGRVQVIPLAWGGTTPVKIRLRSGNHPIARLDEGGTPGPIGPLPVTARDAVAAAAAVLVADYGGGVTAWAPLRAELAAVSARTPILWDPHPRGSAPVPGTCWVMPNESELWSLGAGADGSPSTAERRENIGSTVDHRRTVDDTPTGGSDRVDHVPASAGRRSIGDTRRRAEHLALRWGARGVCVTLGARGAMLCTVGNPPLMVAPMAVAVGDTCGAGDSFASAAAAAFADGALPSEVVSTAVDSAARFVAAGGAAAFQLPPAQMLHQTTSSAPTSASMQRLLSEVRRRGGTVIATGGCFDLLHAGHVATLQAARALGDLLVVCLNSDASVRRLKGAGRPLQGQDDRSRVLAALHCVDAVVVFDEDTPSAALERIRPDLWVKGGDYSGLELPEAAVLAQWGGEVVTVPYLPGRSTTALVELAASPAP